MNHVCTPKECGHDGETCPARGLTRRKDSTMDTLTLTEPVACPGDVVATEPVFELTARARPILFSAPMVRALLSGTKTQTRRIIKPQPARVFSYGSAFPLVGEIYAYNSPDEGWMLVRAGRQPRENVLVARCPYGVPGDALWVREAFAYLSDCRHNDPGVQALADNGFYRADDGTTEGDINRWRPSIHMPRWASRITLKITDVRVERLDDISEADALAEGMTFPEAMQWGSDPCDAYRGLWEHINGEGSWAANPWCWAVSFEIANTPEGA